MGQEAIDFHIWVRIWEIVKGIEKKNEVQGFMVPMPVTYIVAKNL